MVEKILVVEDAVEYQKVISRALGRYDVSIASSAEEASKKIQDENFDLVVLDIVLPGQNGFSFLSDLQGSESTRGISVFCVTSKSEITDKTTAFALGADDYIAKPFDPIELKARIDAKLAKKRRLSRGNQQLKIGRLLIDLNLHRVFIAGSEGQKKEVQLTQTEFKILCHLGRRIDQIYTRDQLLQGVWGEDAGVLDRVVDVHVCSLRKKLQECSNYIRAVPGVGYGISAENVKKDLKKHE